jgi:hypothetical protein
LHDSGATWGLPFVSPLPGNELAVPAEDRVGSDERSDFGKSAPSDKLAADGKSSALGVGQSKSFRTELLLENSVFLSEIFDDRVLLTGDPSGHCGYEDLPGLKNECHPEIVVLGDHNRQLSGTAGNRLFFPGFGSAEKADTTASMLEWNVVNGVKG